jgi:DNA-binding NarL/FixJ family response regulator
MPTAIVSRPGVMQQSLRTSLVACPRLAVVASLGDGLTALNYVDAQRPALLAIDCNLLDEEVEALLAAIKSRRLPTRCLVFIHSRLRTAWALGAGADAVMLHDGSPKELSIVLSQFYEEQAGE